MKAAAGVSFRDASASIPVASGDHQITYTVAGDRDTVVDLNTSFNRCYDRGGFAGRIDYRRDPPMPLPEDVRAAAGETSGEATRTVEDGAPMGSR